MHVSHETIYQALYVLPRNALKAVLVQEGLRQHHEKRRQRSKLGRTEPEVRFSGTSVDERPAEVATRLVPGHWEGDLIKGEKSRSEVAVLLERQSRRVVLARLTDAKAATVRQGVRSRVLSGPAQYGENLDLRSRFRAGRACVAGVKRQD